MRNIVSDFSGNWMVLCSSMQVISGPFRKKMTEKGRCSNSTGSTKNLQWVPVLVFVSTSTFLYCAQMWDFLSELPMSWMAKTGCLGVRNSGKADFSTSPSDILFNRHLSLYPQLPGSRNSTSCRAGDNPLPPIHSRKTG